jgi:hypothetical protein
LPRADVILTAEFKYGVPAGMREVGLDRNAGRLYEEGGAEHANDARRVKRRID